MTEPQAANAARPESVVDLASAVYPDWEAVYRDNVVGIYQLVYRKVGNAADAEDLAEDVLMQTLKTLRLPAPAHNVRSYLAKTARTVLADHWRRHYAVQNATLELQQLPQDGGGEVSSESADRAQRVLALLPDNFRQILELRFLRGYSVGEVAREMGITDSYARVLQFRALRKAALLDQEVLR